MNKKLWEFNEIGEASVDNDANDYYYSWVNMEAGDKDIKELFEQFLSIGYDATKIRVKARKGAIFIVVEGDKDDTPNPEM